MRRRRGDHDERHLRGADPVSLATALSVWLPGRIRLIRAQPTVRM